MARHLTVKSTLPSRLKLYRHTKSGGVYAVIGDGRLESDLQTVRIYINVVTKQIWVRSRSEFDEFMQIIGRPGRYRRFTPIMSDDATYGNKSSKRTGSRKKRGSGRRTRRQPG